MRRRYPHLTRAGRAAVWCGLWVLRHEYSTIAWGEQVKEEGCDAARRAGRKGLCKRRRSGIDESGCVGDLRDGKGAPNRIGIGISPDGECHNELGHGAQHSHQHVHASPSDSEHLAGLASTTPSDEGISAETVEYEGKGTSRESAAARRQRFASLRNCIAQMEDPTLAWSLATNDVSPARGSAFTATLRETLSHLFPSEVTNFLRLISDLPLAEHARRCLWVSLVSMIRTGLQPQPWHYKHLLWVYLERMGEGGDKDQAWKTYGRLRRLGCAAADMRIYAMFLIWAVDRSSQKDVEWVYQTMRRSEIGFTAEGFDECAGIHAAVGDGPGVLTLYRMMTEAGVTPTEMAYGNVIRALTRCDDVESSEWVVSDMRSRGWSPPTNAIAALMSASLKSGESLEEWLELIRQHQLTPDVPVFIVVLMKAMRDRPYEEVAALIDKVLRDSPFEPNAVMFTVCIRYHMKHGHFDTAVQVFEDMEKCNVEPQAFNYGDMIEGCLINNRLEKVDGYLKAMSDRGLAPDKYMVANIIHAYIARGELKTALQTFYLLRNPILSTALSKILHSPTSSLPLTSASSSPSSSSSSSSSSPSPPPPPSPSTSLPHIPHLAQTSSSVSPSFRYHRPIRLNSYFVTLLMTTLGRESPSTALSMFFYLRSRGARVDAATYSQLLAYHVADIPNFNAIWRDMEAAGVRPRVEVYTPLIMSLLHSVDRGSVGRECMVILEEMASKGVLPNAVVYNAAIQTCAKADESVWCERLVARMQAEGFALDAHTYDWMVGVWTQYARDMVRAEVWAERRKFALGGYGARVRKRMAYGFALIRDEQAARAWLEKAEAEGEAPAKDVWYDEILNKLKTIEQLKNERDGVAEGPKAQGMRSSLVKPSDKLGRKESNREPPPPTPSVSSAGPRIGTPGGDDGSIKWWKETSLAEADIPPPLPNHATGRWSGLVAQVRASLSIPKGDDDDGGGGAEGNKGGNQVGR